MPLVVGLVVQTGASAELIACIMMHNTAAALDCHPGTHSTVNRCQIEKNNCGVLVRQAAAATLMLCELSQNSIGVEVGFGGGASLEHCRVEHSKGSGMLVATCAEHAPPHSQACGCNVELLGGIELRHCTLRANGPNGSIANGSTGNGSNDIQIVGTERQTALESISVANCYIGDRFYSTSSSSSILPECTTKASRPSESEPKCGNEERQKKSPGVVNKESSKHASRRAPCVSCRMTAGHSAVCRLGGNFSWSNQSTNIKEPNRSFAWYAKGNESNKRSSSVKKIIKERV